MKINSFHKKKIVISVSMSKKLFELIEEKRGDINRSVYITNILKKYVKGGRQ